ncbi:hypothetical protein IE53DRAFT_366736 [Violaceomyces palustris]|uniref:Uncharacterized protein n=1 Tax=Violaceomyces palustris TaxID=1673888 RepID=A0ACD0P4P9_9BASI|nr:hypothetical protein IE53DRAFT_366736 [Violaceomyces palustris]
MDPSPEGEKEPPGQIKGAAAGSNAAGGSRQKLPPISSLTQLDDTSDHLRGAAASSSLPQRDHDRKRPSIDSSGPSPNTLFSRPHSRSDPESFTTVDKSGRKESALPGNYGITGSEIQAQNPRAQTTLRSTRGDDGKANMMITSRPQVVANRPPDMHRERSAGGKRSDQAGAKREEDFHRISNTPQREHAGDSFATSRPSLKTGYSSTSSGFPSHQRGASPPKNPRNWSREGSPQRGEVSSPRVPPFRPLSANAQVHRPGREPISGPSWTGSGEASPVSRPGSSGSYPDGLHGSSPWQQGPTAPIGSTSRQGEAQGEKEKSSSGLPREAGWSHATPIGPRTDWFPGPLPPGPRYAESFWPDSRNTDRTIEGFPGEARGRIRRGTVSGPLSEVERVGPEGPRRSPPSPYEMQPFGAGSASIVYPPGKGGQLGGPGTRPVSVGGMMSSSGSSVISSGPATTTTATSTASSSGPSANRRVAHLLSEQRRRESINSGFEDLRQSLPACRDGQDSKATVLRRAVEYIHELESIISREHRLKAEGIERGFPVRGPPAVDPRVDPRELPSLASRAGPPGATGTEPGGPYGPNDQMSQDRSATARAKDFNMRGAGTMVDPAWGLPPFGPGGPNVKRESDEIDQYTSLRGPPPPHPSRYEERYPWAAASKTHHRPGFDERWPENRDEWREKTEAEERPRKRSRSFSNEQRVGRMMSNEEYAFREQEGIASDRRNSGQEGYLSHRAGWSSSDPARSPRPKSSYFERPGAGSIHQGFQQRHYAQEAEGPPFNTQSPHGESNYSRDLHKSLRKERGSDRGAAGEPSGSGGSAYYPRWESTGRKGGPLP